MKDGETGGRVSLISDFNDTKLLGHFNLGPGQDIEAKAMRYFFRATLRDIMDDETNRATAAREAIRRSIEKIELNYGMFDSYADDFLRNDPFDREALAIAAILGDFISDAGPDARDELTGIFGAPMMHDIGILNNEAVSICNGDDGNFLRQSLFLAHVRALMDIRDIEEAIDELPLIDMMSARHDTLDTIRSFTDKNTAIGRELYQQRGYIADLLDEKLTQNQSVSIGHADTYVIPPKTQDNVIHVSFPRAPQPTPGPGLS